MSLVPPQMPGDIERSFWSHIPSRLRGRVTSLKEISGLFPDFVDREVGIIRTEQDYIVYGVNVGLPVFLAYDCMRCDTLVIGPPTIEDDLSIRRGIPLSGREGYDIYCTNCSSQIGSATFKVS